VRFEINFEKKANFSKKNYFTAIPFLPIQILLAFLISRYTTGRYPMTFYMKAFKLRIGVAILLASYLYMTPKIIGNGDSIPWYYYVGITTVFLLYQVAH
jgi:hypothetical protein